MFINAELSQLPVGDGRKASRRILNLAAALREDGATNHKVQVIDISTGGFRVTSKDKLEEGAEVWLKMPGLEAKRSHIIWVKDNEAGCEFESEMNPYELQGIKVQPRKGPVRNIFGHP